MLSSSATVSSFQLTRKAKNSLVGKSEIFFLMATFLSFLLLSATLTTLIPSAAASATLPTTSTRQTVYQTQAIDSGALQQLFNIIEALIGSGDLGNWGNILNGINPAVLPFSATLFIPGGDRTALPQDRVVLDPSIFSYHIVPQRLTFSDLSLFPVGSRLPTLLPNNSILITNNSISNFCLDGALLTRPDLYSTQSVSVHGIGRILNYSIYGNARYESIMRPPPPMKPKSHEPKEQGSFTAAALHPPVSAVPPPPPFTEIQQMTGRRASHATRLKSVSLVAVFSAIGMMKMNLPS